MNLGLEENLFEFSTTWSTSGTLLGTILWVSGFNCICILFLYRMLSSLCGCFRLSRPINLFHRFCAVTKKIQVLFIDINIVSLILNRIQTILCDQTVSCHHWYSVNHSIFCPSTRWHAYDLG